LPHYVVADACASLWIDGEFVNLEDFVLHRSKWHGSHQHLIQTHRFLKVPIGSWITELKENSIKRYAFGKMDPFETDHLSALPYAIIRCDYALTL